MLASKVTQVLTDVPGYPGVPVTIRQLSAKALRLAQEEKGVKAIEAYKRIAAFQREIAAMAPDKPAESAGPVADVDPVATVLDEYDPFVVVTRGVVDIDGTSAPADLADDLAEEPLMYLHEQVLRLSVPRRFEGEAERKNA